MVAPGSGIGSKCSEKAHVAATGNQPRILQLSSRLRTIWKHWSMIYWTRPDG